MGKRNKKNVLVTVQPSTSCYRHQAMQNHSVVA